MEIRSSFCIIFINCVLIQYLEAKSVSLNEIIAAESEGQPVTEKPSSKFPDPGAKDNSLHEIIAAESKLKRVLRKPTPRKLKDLLRRLSLANRLATKPKLKKIKLDKINLGLHKISPLTYKKAFEIKSPLRPKKLKVSQKLRHKRKNQSRKREISGNELHTEKYIPLLKSFSMLFDNLLNSDESDSYETKPKKYKSYRFFSDERSESLVNYSSGPRFSKSKTHKETTTPSPAISTEVSQDTESVTHNEDHDYSTNRPNKDIPVLLPRNTFSFRRNDNGSSKRSSSTFDGDFEGNITRNHRDYEHNTRCRGNESCEEDDENNSYSSTRSYPSSIGHSRTDGTRYNARNSNDGKTVDGNNSKDESTDDRFGKIQFETRGNETESKNSIREPVRRLRGYVHEAKGATNERSVSEPPELLQLKEVREESFLSATDDSTGHKRIIDKNGPLTTEDEKIRTGNETVILIERYSRNGNHSKIKGKKVPVVLIFDGYSVTRDKNGENKVSGKTIHVHP